MHGLCMVQFEGFPGKSRRADWEEQQEARELITRGQTYWGDTARGGYFTDSAELCEAHKRVEASEQSPLGLPGPGQGPLVLCDCLRH